MTKPLRRWQSFLLAAAVAVSQKRSRLAVAVSRRRRPVRRAAGSRKAKARKRAKPGKRDAERALSASKWWWTQRPEWSSTNTGPFRAIPGGGTRKAKAGKRRRQVLKGRRNGAAARQVLEAGTTQEGREEGQEEGREKKKEKRGPLAPTRRRRRRTRSARCPLHRTHGL